MVLFRAISKEALSYTRIGGNVAEKPGDEIAKETSVGDHIEKEG